MPILEFPYPLWVTREELRAMPITSAANLKPVITNGPGPSGKRKPRKPKS